MTDHQLNSNDQCPTLRGGQDGEKERVGCTEVSGQAVLKIIGLLVLCSITCAAQQVMQVRWPSRQTAAPISLKEVSMEVAAAVRLGLATMPEETIVSATLLQGEALGLSSQDAAQLRQLFAGYYQRMRRSEIFKNAPSALPYCFSERKPPEGLATVYVPKQITEHTRTIVFLNGYGGSLLAYLHFMSTTFPSHVIICPAYGISPDKIPLAYISEAERAVSRQNKVQARPPLLIGLSAGAFGAFRAYQQRPEAFRSLICMAAFAPPDAMKQFKGKADIRFVCGGKESYVADGSFQRQMLALKPKVRSLEWKTIPGAGHFFLLSDEQQTRKVLAEWEKP